MACFQLRFIYTFNKTVLNDNQMAYQTGWKTLRNNFYKYKITIAKITQYVTVNYMANNINREQPDPVVH